MTKCGHSFCYECICRCLEQGPRCPKCNFHLDGKNDIFPNFVLNELVAKHKNIADQKRRHNNTVANLLSQPEASELKGILFDTAPKLGLSDIEYIMNLLSERRNQLEVEAFLTQQTLLAEFLTHLKRLKDDQLMQLRRETSVIQADLDKVNKVIQEVESNKQRASILEDKSESDEPVARNGETSESSVSVVPTLEGFNVFRDRHALTHSKTTLPHRRRRMHHHFEDLTECYFGARSSQMMFPPEDEEEGPSYSGLNEFSDCLTKFTRYSDLRPLATLSYTTDMFNNASIVSSIEFDKDKEFFAIAGVTKRIKLYDYQVVLKDMVDIHYPSIEMVCGSKISCVTWSSFHKSTLASSDYDCTVVVWDANTAQKLRMYQEHEKRCWSVDFNSVDTKMLASGSDDARVKLWSTNVAHSVATLEARANVCCVKFNPTSCYHLAFGSADHCVHYYDLRNTKAALNIFRGHKKAVSYVKFLNADSLVSASTDSQLKLWNVNHRNCERSFVGHINEKNFVGLATDGDYITCGSENNSLYVYYRGLSKPLFSFKFNGVRSLLERERREEDANEFVSAVCWRQDSPVVVAANSQGTIKVLELV